MANTYTYTVLIASVLIILSVIHTEIRYRDIAKLTGNGEALICPEMSQVEALMFLVGLIAILAIFVCYISKKLDKKNTRTSRASDAVLKELEELRKTKRCFHEDKDRKCCICWSNPPSFIAIKCGHYIVCGECAIKLVNCPLCRVRTEWIKVYCN